MNKIRSVLFQALFWLLLFIVLWQSQGGGYRFVTENIVLLLFQIVLIYVLVYYMAPKFLFKKKYIHFAIYSLGLLGLATFVSAKLLNESQFKPPPRHLGPPRIKIPSKLFINFLILNAGYLLATFFETFLFAQKKERETIKNKSEQLETELKLLKSQINPHFLFNSLNNIYAMSVIDSDKTQQSISNLSDMLRYVLYECEQDAVKLKKEITYIENYIKLFSLKSSRPYPIQMDCKVIYPNILIAPMLIIPFVENAIKHSNIEKRKGSFINISIDSTNNSINFGIENSLSKNVESKDGIGGIGLENAKKRLNILYPDAHQLTIDHGQNTFKVNLFIKLINDA